MVKVKAHEVIVMVDDNQGDIYLAKQCFDWSGLPNPWKSFSSGVEFLADLDSLKAGQLSLPGLVLLDLNMPRMSGLEVLAHVRADAYFANLPIFCMLTSSADPRDRAQAIEVGASGFVTKPGDLDAYVDFFKSFV